MVDHAKRLQAQERPQVTFEEGPARWKVILAIPLIGAAIYLGTLLVFH